jgi:hypothetical protein
MQSKDFLGSRAGYPLQILGHFVPHGLWVLRFYPCCEVF